MIQKIISLILPLINGKNSTIVNVVSKGNDYYSDGVVLLLITKQGNKWIIFVILEGIIKISSKHNQLT